MTPARHFVATAYVVSGGKTLLIRHRKLGWWLPPGGHIEDGELPDDAALREVREETGLDAELLSPVAAGPCEAGVRYLAVPLHVQLEDIPNHPQHIDLIYVCRPKPGARESVSLEEAHEMRWFSREDLAGPDVRAEVRRTALEAIAFAQSLTSAPS